MAPAVGNRSAGTRASARAASASTARGTLSRIVVIVRGASVSRRAMMACAVGPVNGGSPASIS